MSDFDIDAACERVARFYETLAPRHLDGLAGLYAEQARFVDPFNDVRGPAAIAAIFRHMFATVEAPRFTITHRIARGREAMLGWRFALRLRGRDLVIEGVSHLLFDADGRIALHRDYWDAAGELYAQLPLVGGLMRALRRRLATPAAYRA